MTKTLKLIIFGLLFFPVIGLGQKSNSFTIDTSKILKNEILDDFVQNLKNDTFQNFVDKTAIPKFIKKQLSKLANGFSIANPDKPYRCCCSSPGRLPKRQLDFLAKSKDVLVMTYKTGGIGVSTHLLLIRFDNKKIIGLWSGYCWEDMKNVGDIVFFINESRQKNRELNTNLIIH